MPRKNFPEPKPRPRIELESELALALENRIRPIIEVGKKDLLVNAQIMGSNGKFRKRVPPHYPFVPSHHHPDPV